MGRRLAILVGCEKYLHGDLSPLRFCSDDVRRLESLLARQGFSCEVLSDDQPNTSRSWPTARNIDDALSRTLAGVTRNDLVMVVLSGHGLQPPGASQPYFCPLDANPTLEFDPASGKQRIKHVATVLGIGDLLLRLKESGVGRKLVVVDACRDAPLMKGSKASGVQDVNFELLPDETGVFLSCSRGEYSFENEKLGNGGSGIFLHFFSEGISGAAANGRGEITWDRLVDHVKSSVQETAPTLTGGAQQTPHSISNLPGTVTLARAPVRPADSEPHPAPPTTTPSAPPASEPPSEIAWLKWPSDESRAKSIQAACAASLGRPVVEANSVGLELVVIPPGRFMMGSPPSESSRDRDERTNRVALTVPFRMARTEVTRAQWKRVMATTPWGPSTSPGTDDDLPASGLTRDAALQFCQAISAKEGLVYRLPTEAEWEWACRAGGNSPFCFGENDRLLGRYAWFQENCPEAHVNKVAAKRPNVFGLFDMHGNVSEWCADLYRDRVPGGDNPVVMDSNILAGVIRGGSYLDEFTRCRSAFRYGATLTKSHPTIGFRPVVEIREISPKE